VRIIALLLLIATTVCAQANTSLISVSPNASITPEQLGHEMSGIPACSAATGAPALNPSPQTMFLEVAISKGAIARVSAMTSSGNPAFDQKAIQCLQSLPAEFPTKIGEDVLMFVSVYASNGAVAPDPSTTFVPPLTATPNGIAIQHTQLAPGAAPPAPATTSPPPGTQSVGVPPGGCVAYYPPLAIRLNQEGDVDLVFTITANGTVKDVLALKSSGYAALDQAAAHCAGFWRYKPATRNGIPVDIQWHAVVKFKLGTPSPEAIAQQIASQRGLNKLFHDSYACLNAAQIDEDELAKSSHAVTGLTVHFLDGVISSVDITHSSGHTTLDELAANCFRQQKYDTEMAQSLIHQKNWYVPVVWSIINPKRSVPNPTPAGEAGTVR
jgi:TonB family protein